MHVPRPREAKAVSDKGDATALITVLDTLPRIAAGDGMNTGPLRIKGLAIRVPMHRELGPYARETGAGHARSIVLVLDDAGWHGPAGLATPDGISLAFLPPYSPELQPAERLWPLMDEPNRQPARRQPG